MKDLSSPQSNLEHQYAKSTSLSLTKKRSDHGYAKSSSSSSTKKNKKIDIVDPKQRKLSFAKVPSLHKVEATSLSSDSDEPLSSIKSNEDNTTASNFVKKSDHSMNGTAQKSPNKSPNKKLAPILPKEVEVLPLHSPNNESKKRLGFFPKHEKAPAVIPSTGCQRITKQSEESSLKGQKHEKKLVNTKKVKQIKNKSSPLKKKHTPGSGKKLKKEVMTLSTDSDSDLDVPLSKLKTSPKFKSKSKSPLKSLKSMKKMSLTERSPKVKISHSKSPKIKGKKGLKQRTLFDVGTQMKKDRGNAPNEKRVKDIELFVSKIDWKGLSEEEREKIRQQKKDEWNRVRRERNKMLNQKYDDLELPNITPLPAAKPINLEGGLTHSAFGDIAMVVEFIYAYNKFLAPEETPSITADVLIKALAAGSQGANVISKIVLVFLRALIGEEEREINGLGIGLADMPLTAFTVSELLYHYIRLTCEKPSKEQKDDDEDDDASSVGSAVVDPVVSQEELPRRIIDSLEKNELYTLPASDQLKILVFLFYKIIDSEYFSEFLENLKMEAKELWRQQDAFRKKAAKERKEEQMKNESKTHSPSDTMKIDQFAKKVDPSTENDAEKKDVKNEEGKNGAESKGVDINEAEKETKVEEIKKEKNDKVAKKADGNKKEPVDIESKADVEMMKDYPKEPVADLVHTVRQRRIMSAKQAALKDEEEKKEKERRNELDELRQKMKKVQAWKDSLDRCKKTLRLEPIGVDRHFKLYWIFSQGMPGIYVEDGYMYHAVENRTIDSWECYDSVQDIDKLLKALAKQGIRESALKTCISNQYKAITSAINKKSQENSDLQPYNVFEESIKVLKEDLLESGTKIVKGALGMISNQEGWEKQVEEAKTLEEMVPLLLELQQSVMPKFLEGAMSQSTGEHVVQNWRENVKQVKTMSALHMYLGILENSVKWDKSAENAKCKICRRKGGDDYFILCDECNRAFHPYCLRPALIDFLADNWKCPACAPAIPVSRSRNRRKEEPVDYDETGRDEESGEEDEKEEDKEQGDDEDDTDHESQCHVCGEDGELICCDQCPKVYHLDCHEPPIRRLPRGIWICFVCRNPRMATRQRRAQEKYEKAAKQRNKALREGKKSGGRGGRRSGRRQRQAYQEDDDDEEESSETDAENETEEDVDEKPGRDGRRRSKKKEVSSDEESVDEDEEDEEPLKKGRRRSGRNSKQRRRSITPDDVSSEASPPTRKRGKVEDSCEEEPESKRGRRGSRPRNKNENGDAEEHISKKTTRKRKMREGDGNSGYEREEKGKVGKKSKIGDRDSGELNFGRRSRNRHRGQNSEIVACENILRGMWKSKNAHHFRNPVDLKKVPDYEKFVSNPMDLSKIRDKLEMLEYEDAFQFVDDVKLLFANSRKYNEDVSDVGQDGKKLETEFHELLRENLPGLHNSLCDEE